MGTVRATGDSGKRNDEGGRIRNFFREGSNFGKKTAVPTRSHRVCIVEETTECGAVDVFRIWK